jgi:hypothetical protein
MTTCCCRLSLLLIYSIYPSYGLTLLLHLTIFFVTFLVITTENLAVLLVITGAIQGISSPSRHGWLLQNREHYTTLAAEISLGAAVSLIIANRRHDAAVIKIVCSLSVHLCKVTAVRKELIS